MYNYSTLGKYRYKCLPIGVTNSPDIFQQKMNDLFHGFEFICVYMDDILVLTKGYWTYHLRKLYLTLKQMEGKMNKCNIDKYLFGNTEMEYLGFLGNTRWRKIHRKNYRQNNTKPLTFQKQIRQFIGVVSYYSNM